MYKKAIQPTGLDGSAESRTATGSCQEGEEAYEDNGHRAGSTLVGC